MGQRHQDRHENRIRAASATTAADAAMNTLISPARFYPGYRSVGGTINDSGVMQLVNGQNYIVVTFDQAQVDDQWLLVECSIVNTTDTTPLNILPAIITSKTAAGFTLQLAGMPDTDHYFLHWAISGFVAAPVPATTYILSGPSTGAIGIASSNFTVHLSTGTTLSSAMIVTPHDGSGGGTFTPATVALSTVAPSTTFTYTPASGGAKTISTTNNKGLTDPSALTYTAGAVDGSPVSTWPDSSVNGNNATQTGSARPIFKTNVVNGKPVVRFTVAASSSMNLTTPVSTVWPWCAFVVLKPLISSSPMLVLTSGAGPGHPMSLYFTGSSLLWSDRDTYKTSSIAEPTGFHVVTTNAPASGSLAAYVDGGADISVGSGANPAPNNFSVIGSGASLYTDGDIAEIIIYNATLSGTDRANIEKYLGTKYGITVAGGSAVQPDTVTGLKGWWKADSL